MGFSEILGIWGEILVSTVMCVIWEIVHKVSQTLSLEKMDKFLETYNLPKLNHVEIGNLNRSITSKNTEAVSKTCQQTKV